jgi:hypothetical protein
MRRARGDDPGAQPSPLDLVIANGHDLKLESRAGSYELFQRKLEFNTKYSDD